MVIVICLHGAKVQFFFRKRTMKTSKNTENIYSLILRTAPIYNRDEFLERL